MRLLFLILFAISGRSAETGDTATGGTFGSSAFLHQYTQIALSTAFLAPTEAAALIPSIPTQALLSLKPVPKPFTVEYGNGKFTQKLENATMDLLSNEMISGIVGALSTDVQSSWSQSKMRFLLNVNKRELQFSYRF